MDTTQDRQLDLSLRNRRLRSPSRPLLAVGAAVLAGVGATALAQQAAPKAADSPRGAAVLEEIVVTASRREESLSKVSLSVTAINQDTIDIKGIKDFQDVVRFTPGVTFDTTGTNAISIRGISSSGGAGTTGIYIDDTPIQMRSVGFNPDDALPKTFDLERVEVLRGPQGTLFGSGSEGGTVRYIMTQPSLTKESTYARTEVATTRGGDASYEAGIAHGGVLIDGKLGYRASIWYRYDGGYIDRIDPTSSTPFAVVDHNANHGSAIAGRIAFVWQPVDGVTFTPAVMYQNTRKHDEPTFWPAYSAGSRFVNGTPERYPVPDEYYMPSLKIESDLGRMKFVSSTSFYHRDEVTAYQGTVYDLAYFQSLGWLPLNGTAPSCGSGSTTPFDPVNGCSWYPLMDAKGIHLAGVLAAAGLSHYSTPNRMTNQQDNVTQELRLQSNDPSSRWQWTVGAFWSLAKEVSVEELNDPQIIPFWNALFGVDPRNYFGDYYSCNGVGPAGLVLPNCDIYYARNATHDRQLAAFGEASYNFTDRLKVTVGGRFASMSFDLRHYGDGLENFGPDSRSGNYHENAFTPKFGLSFQADPDNLFYFTYAKGFRPGGVNSPLPQDLCGVTPLAFKSDSTQSFEVGSKNSFASRLRIATSVYYIKWNEIQQSVYDPGPQGLCGFQYIDNTGTAVAKGFDLQAEAVLGGGLSLDLAVGYTSARYSKDSPLASNGDAISGQAAVNYNPGTSPPWNVAVGPQYNFDMMGHESYVRFDWEYASRNPWRASVQDPVNTTQYNANSYTLPATTFASLRAGVKLGTWSVALFVDNLFDTKTITGYAFTQLDKNNPSFDPAVPQSIQQNQYVYRPRTIGITATYRP